MAFFLAFLMSPLARAYPFTDPKTLYFALTSNLTKMEPPEALKSILTPPQVRPDPRTAFAALQDELPDHRPYKSFPRTAHGATGGEQNQPEYAHAQLHMPSLAQVYSV